MILVSVQCGSLVKCRHFSTKEHLWVCRDQMLKSVCDFCSRYDGHDGTERSKVGADCLCVFDLVLVFFGCNLYLFIYFHTEHTGKRIGPGDHSESFSHTELNPLRDPAEHP